MTVTQYIGARYVPIFADPDQWDKTKTYEPLTIVLNEGNSYTSKQYVPAGIDLTNTDFWALTGNYNAQVEAYRKEVQDQTEKVAANSAAIEDLETDMAVAEADIAKNAQDIKSANEAIQKNASDIASANESIQKNAEDIASEQSAREEADNNFSAMLTQQGTNLDQLTSKIAALGIKNVSDFGAKGDGTTDDTAAIQQAMEGGGIVWFEAGKTYKVTQIEPESYSVLMGNHAKIYSEATQGVINIKGAQGDVKVQITIQDLEITGKSGVEGNTGIWIGQTPGNTNFVSRIFIQRCFVHGMGTAGIHTHSGNAGGGTAGHSHNEVWITDCIVRDNGKIGICNSGTQPYIEGCLIAGNGLEGITVDNGCQSAIISNCRIFYNKGGVGGISADECDGLVISNCIITDNAACGIRFNCNTGRVDNACISNCYFWAKTGTPAISIGNDTTKHGASCSITGCYEANATTAIILFEGGGGVTGSQISQAGNFFKNLGDSNHQTYIGNHIVAQYPLTK